MIISCHTWIHTLTPAHRPSFNTASIVHPTTTTVIGPTIDISLVVGTSCMITCPHGTCTCVAACIPWWRPWCYWWKCCSCTCSGRDAVCRTRAYWGCLTLAERAADTASTKAWSNETWSDRILLMYPFRRPQFTYLWMHSSVKCQKRIKQNRSLRFSSFQSMRKRHACPNKHTRTSTAKIESARTHTHTRARTRARAISLAHTHEREIAYAYIYAAILER